MPRGKRQEKVFIRRDLARTIADMPGHYVRVETNYGFGAVKLHPSWANWCERLGIEGPADFMRLMPVTKSTMYRMLAKAPDALTAYAMAALYHRVGPWGDE